VRKLAINHSLKFIWFYFTQTIIFCFVELWFGTHPNGPSLILFDDGRTESLHEHIQKDPQNILGREVAHYWNNTLPFLFKVSLSSSYIFPNILSECLNVIHRIDDRFINIFQVLSINKPLSIQAHPDKLLAQKLFKQNPQVYKVYNT
jgi:mannose-6-phosphate isomerase